MTSENTQVESILKQRNRRSKSWTKGHLGLGQCMKEGVLFPFPDTDLSHMLA